MAETQKCSTSNEENNQYSQHLPKLKQFSSYLEMGDLATSALILYGFVLYGFTKIGKTSTSHLLSGNPLRGFRQKGRDMVQTVTSRNPKAKIGNTMNSQTVIPNKFTLRNYTVEGQNACIVDTPGYGDSYGILKILANGFFHFRLYSKIQNMKFLVCFDSIHLRNTGREVVQTIVNFTKSFKDYTENKHKLWDSCCFLVTKVDPNEDSLETITQRFQTLVNTLNIQEKPQTLALIKGFIQQMINKKKIFIVKKYRAGESSNDENLLPSIDKKVQKWFTRNLNPQKPDQVDMSNIVFALGRDIIVETTKNDVSREQFASLVRFYNNRILQFIGSKNNSVLKRVFDSLVQDSLGSPFSHDFLKPMADYVKKYYPEEDSTYKDQRQKQETRLFEIKANVSSSQSSKKQKNLEKKIKPKNYPIKKMNALEKIEELKNIINSKPLLGRDIVWIQECQVILFQIIQQLAKAGYSKNDRKKIIYPFGYLVRRIVEQAKVFVLLIQKYSTPALKEQIKQMSQRKEIDIFRPLIDFNGLGFKYEDSNDLTYSQLHQMFVQKFDPENKETQNLQITYDFVEFFNQVQVDNLQTKQKIARITLSYSNQTLNDKEREVGPEQKRRLVEKLSKSFESCKDLYLLSNQQEAKNRILKLLKKLGSNLGRVLVELKQHQLSRKVYKSINSVHSVCKIYNQEIEELEASNQSSIKVRVEYGQYLLSHSRENEAMKMLQETYELAQVEQLDKVCEVISEVMIYAKNKKDQKPNDYESNIFDKVHFQSPPEELFSELRALFRSEEKKSAEKIQETELMTEEIKENEEQQLSQ